MQSLKTSSNRPKKPAPTEAEAAEAVADMRKRMARMVSHSGNFYDHILRHFGFRPITGFFVLKDTGTGAWIVTNPKKCNVKFVNDKFDDYGRLWLTHPPPMERVIKDAGNLTSVLKDGNQFMADWMKKWGPYAGCRGPAKTETTRPKSKKAALAVPAPDPDRARTRFREWQRQKVEGPNPMPSVSDDEKEALERAAREVLRKSERSRKLPPGSTADSVIKIHDANYKAD